MSLPLLCSPRLPPRAGRQLGAPVSRPRLALAACRPFLKLYQAMQPVHTSGI